MQKGRKKKVRYIQEMPRVSQFSPRGKPGRPDEIELKIDQYEALNLADYQGYNQEEGASVMGISRPSFGRILREGRKIVADALVNGKIIKIRTADVQVGVIKQRLPFKKDIVRGSFDSNSAEINLRKSILNFTFDRKKSIQSSAVVIGDEGNEKDQKMRDLSQVKV